MVEDEPGIQAVLANVLRDEGYAVDLAATVRDAQACLAAQPYDLVITDWKLPDGDGTLIADWAAELDAKTFVMSGYLSYMPNGTALGHETLMKPIRLDEFLASIKRAIGEPARD